MGKIQADLVVIIDGNVAPRRMRRVESMGSLTHRTTNGVSVHIDQHSANFSPGNATTSRPSEMGT